jgi:molybdopterin converting factor subunit 1
MSETLTILYFAWLRERTGVAQEELPLPAGVGSVAQLIEHLSGLDARHAAAFANRGTIRCAINQEFAPLSFPVRAGDEVAFFPPVTGG